MSRIKSVLETLKVHKKKSFFGFGVGCYGAHYMYKMHTNSLWMRELCLEARKLGEEPIDINSTPLRITVIFNPAASSGKAKSKFDDYCAPLLHLAGIKLSIIRTEGTGNAKEIMEVMSDADAVLVAGGDGTLMEAVTGLLRREDGYEKKIPLGVLPLGKNNFTAKSLFPKYKDDDIKLLTDATMSVLRRLYRPMDVLEVSDIQNESSKKLYGLRSMDLGAFVDASDRKDKLWFLGPLKNYLTYFFAYTTSQKEITWDVKGKIMCSNSAQNDPPEHEEPPGGWPWPLKSRSSKKLPEEFIHFPEYDGSLLSIKTDARNPLIKDESSHFFRFSLSSKKLSLPLFLSEGIAREKGAFLTPISSAYSAKALIFEPFLDKMKEGVTFSLDGERIELLGPTKFALIPNKIYLFCSEETHYKFAHPDTDTTKHKTKWWQSRSGKLPSSSAGMTAHRIL